MNRQNFEFNGDWEYKIELPMLSGFQERNGAYTSISNDKPNTGLFKLELEDDLTDNPDPYPEQLNTLNFIFDNQEIIAKSIIDRTLTELEEIKINYGLENEEEYQNLNEQKVKSLIGISSIHIKIISKDGFSYFDISGGCNWDEEHGLNILFHKDSVISFGEIDGGSTYEAEKDNGTFDKESNRHLQRKKPQKFNPHPKYNKLKPLQKSANDTYELTLISYGYNEDFIKGVENGEININGKWESQNTTYLEAACWHKNNQLVEYLLGKRAEIRYALHQCVGYGNNPEALEMLLQNGADINAQYGNGNTIIFEIVNNMEGFYRANTYYKSINKLDLMTPENIEKFEALKLKVKDLIKRGADPFIKNIYGYSCFEIMRNSDEESRKELNEFLKQCLNDK
jgi:hypothetical protein